MDVVASVVAAVDAHRGITLTDVVANGLCFLLNLATAPENKVASR